MKSRFLNVDLEVLSRTNPAPLVKALGKKVHVLYCAAYESGYLATFEMSFDRPSLERRLGYFCDLLETLPPPAARIWKQARRRTFDIGLQSGDSFPALALRIEAKTLARVTALGATIAITLYPMIQ